MHLTYDATTDVAYLSFRATGPADVLGPTLLLEHDRDFPGAVALYFGLLDGRVVGLERRPIGQRPTGQLQLTVGLVVAGADRLRIVDERIRRLPLDNAAVVGGPERFGPWLASDRVVSSARRVGPFRGPGIARLRVGVDIRTIVGFHHDLRGCRADWY